MALIELKSITNSRFLFYKNLLFYIKKGNLETKVLIEKIQLQVFAF